MNIRCPLYQFDVLLFTEISIQASRKGGSLIGSYSFWYQKCLATVVILLMAGWPLCSRLIIGSRLVEEIGSVVFHISLRCEVESKQCVEVA